MQKKLALIMRNALLLLLLLLCAATASSKTLEVAVPQGAKAGEVLKVQHGEQLLEVRIPAGSKPGGKLYINAESISKSAAAPKTTKLNVTVPENAKEGHVLYIDYKDRKFQVTVPKGARPGSWFEAIVHLKEEDTEIKEENGVLVLHRGNFDTALQTYPFIVIDFYAPWCGACKKIAPKWEAAAKQLKELEADLSQPVKMAKFDASTAENEPVADAFGVEDYPTLKIFRQGKAFPYRGEWEAQGLVDEIRSQASPALILVDSEEGLKSLQRRRKLVILGMFNESTSGELIEPFSHAAEVMREDAGFGVITNPKTLAGLGLPLAQFSQNPEALFPSVFMLRYYDMEIFPYVLPTRNEIESGDSSKKDGLAEGGGESESLYAFTAEDVGVEAMQKFVKANMLPSVMHLTSDAQHEQSLTEDIQKEIGKMKRAAQKAKRKKEKAPELSPVLTQSRRENPWVTDLFMRDLGDTRGDMLKIKVVAVLQNQSQLPPVLPQLAKLADASDGEVVCAYFVASEFPDLRKLLNVQVGDGDGDGGGDGGDLPALVAINVPNGDKFVVPFEKVKLRKENTGSSMSFDAIDRFVSDVRSDFIKPTIKSEAPPSDRKANRMRSRGGGIVKITGKTFVEDVVDAAEEVMLKLYTPWCGHCKKFAPIYNATAPLYAMEDRIRFAEMDLSKNELPKHLQSMVKSYPTLLWFGGDNPKNISIYDGENALAAVVEYINTNTRLNKTTHVEYQGSELKFDTKLYQTLTVPMTPTEQMLADVEESLHWYLSLLVGIWDDDEVLLGVPVPAFATGAVAAVGVKVDSTTGIAAVTSRHIVAAYLGVLAVLCVVLLNWVSGGGSGSGTTTPGTMSVTASEMCEIRKTMIAVYAKHNPENATADRIDAIVKTWAGKEHQILGALEKKYGRNGSGSDGTGSDNDYEVVEKEEQSAGEPAAESARENENKKDK